MRLSNTLPKFKTLVSASFMAWFEGLYLQTENKENTQLMYSENEKAGALQGTRLNNLKSCGSDFDIRQNSQSCTKWQVNSIASRYRLPLHRAKLICTLSGVGGLV